MITLAAGSLDVASLTALFLSLGILLASSRLLGEITRKLGQPAILGEIVAGILLGPTLLGWLAPDAFVWIFPADGGARTALDGFLALAATLLLLVAGIEVDLSTVMRQGKAAILVSFSGIVFPFLIGFGVAWIAPRLFGMGADADKLTFSLFIGIALSITALPVIAKTLMDLNLLKSDMGMVIISAAMVDDLIGWLGFAMVLALMHRAPGSETPDASGVSAGLSVLGTIGLTAVFVVAMLVGGRWLFHCVLPAIQAHSSWPGGVLGFVLSVALLSAAFTEWIGIHAIFGAFIAGIAVGDSSHLRERTRDMIFQFVTNIFAPIFFASIGLRVNFIAEFNLGLTLFVIFVAILTKVVGCYAGAKLAGLSRRESMILGVGMTGRGAMEIILATLARQAGLITDELFVAIVVMALVTSLFVGPVIQRLVRAKQRIRLSAMLNDRNIVMNLRATEAREAIRELSDRAGQIAGIDPLVIDQAVWDREQMMRTGLGQGMAVPHARLAGLSRPVVVVGRSEPGVDFDAADGLPANLVFLILTPTTDETAQIDLLRALADVFQSASIRELVLKAGGPTEVLAAVNMAEHSPAH